MPDSEPDPEPSFEIVTLRGGTRAVREVASGEVMHPSVGPWREANLLYVAQSRLADALAHHGPPLCLYDVGLGAAANLVAALECATRLGGERRRDLLVVSFEQDLAPLRLALGDEAGFPFLAPWRAALEELVERHRFEAPGIALRLLLGDARVRYADAPWPADVVFFDPFSPASSPALWTPPALASLRARCRDGTGATLFTYSAATPTRVALLLAGFFVGVGEPIGTKVETTAAATRREALVRPLDGRWLERWRRSTARAPHGGWQDEESALAGILERHPQFQE